MKLLLQFIATLIVCFILQTFLPWWSMAFGAIAVSYWYSNKGFQAFIVGFLAIGLLWFGVAFYIDVSTHSILTEKVNKLLPLNSFLITTLVGGLVGGMASLTGALLKAK